MPSSKRLFRYCGWEDVCFEHRAPDSPSLSIEGARTCAPGITARALPVSLRFSAPIAVRDRPRARARAGAGRRAPAGAGPAAARPPRVHSQMLCDSRRSKLPARFILTKSSAARAYDRVAWSIGKSILDRRIGVSSNLARDVCAFFLASRCWAKLELRPGGFGGDHLLRPHPARAGEHNLA